MHFALKARYWVTTISVAITAHAVAIFAPQVFPIYPASVYAIPIIAIALTLDTLGMTAERGRGPLKLLAWSLLVGAALLSALPLRGVLKVPWQVYQMSREAGSPFLCAIWASVKTLGNYSASDSLAIAISLALSLSCLLLVVLLPTRAILQSKVSRHLK